MDNPRVGFSHTAPTPVAGAGTHRPVKRAVLYKTRRFILTHSTPYNLAKAARISIDVVCTLRGIGTGWAGPKRGQTTYLVPPLPLLLLLLLLLPLLLIPWFANAVKCVIVHPSLC
jgi:hypothetical protein